MNNNKINIEKIKQLLPDYITRSLTEAENQEVERAISSSPSLKELYLEMKNALDFAGSVRAEEPVPQYWNNLLPRIHEKIDAKGRRKPFTYAWKIILPVAAVILIFIIYRISFTPEIKISKVEPNKMNNEKIVTRDTVEKKTEAPVQLEQNLVNKSSSHNKPHVVKPREKYQDEENTATKIIQKEDIEKKENISKEIPENDDIASVTEVDDYSIFGAGVPGTIDDEIENELDKLNRSEQNELLETLSKSNL